MNDPEISEIIRGVPLDALMSVEGMPADLAAKVEAMLEIGATTVDVASVISEDGWRIIMVPADAEIEIEFEDPEEDPEDLEAGYESDEDSYEDAPSGGLSGLLDRLRSVFGKSISFEVENSMIARNRKRAAARQPHDFQRAIWATRKGSIRCRICGGAQPPEGQLCAGVTLKDGHEWMDPDPNEPILAVGELTLRSATLAQAYEMIVDTLGCWPQSEAHYVEENPFVDEGLACLNCVAFCPEEEMCCWVEGQIAPSGICKLWVIPDALRKTASISKADTYAPPAGVKSEAAKAERWIEEGHAGSGFTATGRRRAADLAAGNPVSLETIQRIASYLARHEADKQGEGWSPGDPGFPSPGRVAWAAWGGDPAISWTRGILDGMEKGSPSVNEVHVDVPMGSGGRQKKKPESIPSIF